MRGKWWGIVAMGILAVHLLGWNSSLAQSARVLQEWEAFKAKYGQDFRVRWDEVRGTPSPIYGRPIPLGVEAVRDERAIEKATMAFITQHQVLLGVNPQDLKRISAQRVQDPTWWYVVYSQYSHGIRVDGGKVGMVLDGERRPPSGCPSTTPWARWCGHWWMKGEHKESTKSNGMGKTRTA